MNKINNKLDILYIEDDVLTANALIEFISSLENVNSVKHYDNALDVLNYLKDNNFNFDVIITDINMPEKSGLEFLEEFNNNDIYTIVTTAYDDKEYLHNSINLSVNKYLIKPLNFMNLSSAITDAYNKKVQNIQKLSLEKENIKKARFEANEELLSNISHQWRQNLSSISLQSSLINMQGIENVPKEEITETLNVINKKAFELSKSIEKLKFTNEAKLETVNLKEVVKNIVFYFDDLLKKSNIEVGINIDENVMFDTYLDSLKTVLVNIITNCIDEFIFKNIEQGKIDIRGYIEDENIFVEIKDNAGGIDEKILPKIFEAYTTNRFESFEKGLSMYISNSIVKNVFNGNIIASNIENGAVFKLEIPLK